MVHKLTTSSRQSNLRAQVQGLWSLESIETPSVLEHNIITTLPTLVWAYVTHVTLHRRLPLFFVYVEKIGELGDEAIYWPVYYLLTY